VGNPAVILWRVWLVAKWGHGDLRSWRWQMLQCGWGHRCLGWHPTRRSHIERPWSASQTWASPQGWWSTPQKGNRW